MVRQVLTALFIMGLAAASPVRPATPARIVAIGDLHGDNLAWQAIARDARLVDANGHWAGGRTVLVQTGDITDRGPDSLKIIHQLMRLAPEASRAGGRVVVLVGNHEAMQVVGDLRYTHPGELAAFTDARSLQRREAAYAAHRVAIETNARVKQPGATASAIHDAWIAAMPLGRIEHDSAWGPEGELGRWLAGNPAVAKIGGTLFVHGGLSASYAPLKIDEINRRVTAALSARDDSPSSILDDQQGPLWYRGLATDQVEPGEAASAAPKLTIEQELGIVLTAYGAKRIVIGHTPNLKGIAIGYGGRLARIDTGISAYYGGVLGYLEILGDRLVAHAVPRPAADRK